MFSLEVSNTMSQLLLAVIKSLLGTTLKEGLKSLLLVVFVLTASANFTFFSKSHEGYFTNQQNMSVSNYFGCNTISML